MQIKNTLLADLEPGQEGVIGKIMGHGSFRRRLTEMGFVKGKKIKVIKKAPLQDPKIGRASCRERVYHPV